MSVTRDAALSRIAMLQRSAQSAIYAADHHLRSARSYTNEANGYLAEAEELALTIGTDGFRARVSVK